jgi:capsular polysaccharide transport system permease protein
MAAEETSSLLRSLAVQRRVIGALLMREVITRFGRHNLGVLWLFVEPMMFTVGVAMVWSAMGHRDSGTSVVAFALTGYSSVLMWRNSVSHCNGAIRANLNLLFHRNVRVIDVLITRAMLEVVGASASFMLLGSLFVGFGWIAPPGDLMQVLEGWLMLAWFGMALALTIGAATAYSALVERIWVPVAYLLFPLSGAAYLTDWLTPGLRSFVLWLPMVHGIEFVREGFFGPVIRYHYDMAYMTRANALLTLAALWLIRDAGRRVDKE